MEIMDINEKLAEAQSEAAMKEIEYIVRAKQEELTDCVSRAFEQGTVFISWLSQKWKEIVSTEVQTSIQQVAIIYPSCDSYMGRY